MAGYISGSSLRLESGPQLGLRTPEGLARAGRFTSRMAHSEGYWQEDSSSLLVVEDGLSSLAYGHFHNAA